MGTLIGDNVTFERASADGERSVKLERRAGGQVRLTKTDPGGEASVSLAPDEVMWLIATAGPAALQRVQQ